MQYSCSNYYGYTHVHICLQGQQHIVLFIDTPTYHVVSLWRLSYIQGTLGEKSKTRQRYRSLMLILHPTRLRILEKYNISENFRGEEQNFPGWGTGMKPEPPKAARATFLARILGNFVPHRENFRKYYSHDSHSHSIQLDNCDLKVTTIHFKSVNCLKIVVSHPIFSWNTDISKKLQRQMRAWSIDQWS